jgi:hypothetical protein
LGYPALVMLSRWDRRRALGGAEGGAILLNLKTQVEQVGHSVRRVYLPEISKQV